VWIQITSAEVNKAEIITNNRNAAGPWQKSLAKYFYREHLEKMSIYLKASTNLKMSGYIIK
jgi:hypothetical protein